MARPARPASTGGAPRSSAPDAWPRRSSTPSSASRRCCSPWALEYEADERLRELTDDTLGVPGGALLVGAVAVGVVAVGLYTLFRGLTGGFMKDIDLPAAPDRWEPLIEGIGRVGYVAKGIAFGLVGVLLWRAATSADVSTATGLEGAMTAIAGVAAAGPWLLTGVAAGFAAFGVYALARARYPDRDPSS